MDLRPVGVFDSGVGGVSVLAELWRQLPHEQWQYVADSGNCPYGGRGEAFVQGRSRHIVDFLVDQGAKAIVVACNTATAAAAPLLRAAYGVPIIAMEPAIKPAVAATSSGVIGVLATVGTAKSARLTSLIERFGRGVEVLTQPCPGLVEQVERGDLSGPRTLELLERYTAPLVARGADVLVLGCTHYPFLRPALQALLGAEIQLIDTGAAVARQTARVLTERGLLAPAGPGAVAVWTSGSVPATTTVMQRLWPAPIVVNPLPPDVAAPPFPNPTATSLTS